MNNSNNPIDLTFKRLKQNKETALIPFMTIGDPNVETTLDILEQLEKSGAHMVELGVPYSDPLADGPVIQRASERALKGGITILDCIHIAGEARKRGIRMPFILFTYYNPVLQLGFDRFFQLLQENDISGLIIPDLPYEEDHVIRDRSEQSGIHLIPLVAPTSHDRIAKIVGRAAGFIYCVSSLGVTGVRTNFHSDVEQFVSTVKQSTDLPVAVGFGISKREHVEQFGAISDGVIVGSAIIRKIEEVLTDLQSPHTKQQALQDIGQFVEELRGPALSN